MHRILLLQAALILALLAPPAAALEADESKYINSIDSDLDGLIAQYSKLPQHPVIFSANLLFAHGVAVKGVSTNDLLAYTAASLVPRACCSPASSTASSTARRNSWWSPPP